MCLFLCCRRDANVFIFMLTQSRTCIFLSASVGMRLYLFMCYHWNIHVFFYVFWFRIQACTSILVFDMPHEYCVCMGLYNWLRF